MRVTLLEPRGALTAEICHDAMSLACGQLLPLLDSVRQWTPLEQAIAYDWAMREHLAAAGNRIQRRARPRFTVPR